MYFAQITRMWEAMFLNQFLARMTVGVRGNRITGIENPLDDAQLWSLYSYYQFGDLGQQLFTGTFFPSPADTGVALAKPDRGTHKTD